MQETHQLSLQSHEIRPTKNTVQKTSAESRKIPTSIPSTMQNMIPPCITGDTVFRHPYIAAQLNHESPICFSVKLQKKRPDKAGCCHLIFSDLTRHTRPKISCRIMPVTSSLEAALLFLFGLHSPDAVGCWFCAAAISSVGIKKSFSFPKSPNMTLALSTSITCLINISFLATLQTSFRFLANLSIHISQVEVSSKRDTATLHAHRFQGGSPSNLVMMITNAINVKYASFTSSHFGKNWTNILSI